MPLPRGFVPPCLPTKAPQPPSGDTWIHEIKHDGFRVIARKDGERVRLYSRPGNDLTYRFPLIVEALARLRSRSCIIDGEAVCCDEDGMSNFDRIPSSPMRAKWGSKALCRNGRTRLIARGARPIGSK
jgi:ATP-dependent DNA ligase